VVLLHQSKFFLCIFFFCRMGWLFIEAKQRMGWPAGPWTCRQAHWARSLYRERQCNVVAGRWVL